MEADKQQPLWVKIRNAVAEDRIFKLNIGNPNDVDREVYADVLLANNVATISDWGLHNNVELAENGQVITPDTIARPFADPLKGKINWTKIRDRLHEEKYSDRDTKVKAGQVTGNIRTFLEEVSEGDIILGNFPEGTVPGIVTGPVIFDTESEYCQYDKNHVFSRSIKWAIINDEALSISTDLLPPGFGPSRRSIGKVKDPSTLVEILRAIEWVGNEL